MGTQLVHGRTKHHGVGLAHVIRFALGGRSDQGRHGPGGRQCAFSRGAGDIGVGGDEARPVVDQADRAGDGLKGIGAGLAQHHEIRAGIAHHEAGLVHGRGQPGFADDERRALGRLIGEKSGGGQGRCPDLLLGYLEPTARQLGGQITRGVHRVVGQHQKRRVVVAPMADEIGRARQGLVFVDQHAVHVGQPALDGAGAFVLVRRFIVLGRLRRLLFLAHGALGTRCTGIDDTRCDPRIEKHRCRPRYRPLVPDVGRL